MTKSNETASFFVKQKNYRTCLITSEPNKPIKHTIQTGLKRPLDKGSSGHVLSSFHNLPIKNKIDSFFNSKANKQLFNGNILFAQDNRVVISKSYGYLNPKKKDSLTLENTFQMASASKPFTAIAILQLCEKGLLNLEDTIQKFIPNFPYKGIDVHQLLCHRSGLSQYTHFCDAPDSIWPDKSVTINNQDVIEIISRIVPLINYKPNHKYYYCNTNYLLLASIVEQVSGLSFKQYVKKYIFNPSGMFSSTIYDRTNCKGSKIFKLDCHLCSQISSFREHYTDTSL